MCAIFGFVGDEPVERLEIAARLMNQRGPDGFGTLHVPDERLFLAHCRLAIIDLSDRGRQPMCNETGDVWVVFNGEIYNFQSLREQLIGLGHQFKSSTDTEVIVHAYEQWGDGFVDRISGMFGLAVWDKKRRRLVLVRDRIGIKPLYWFQSNGRFGFASEIKSLTGLAHVGDMVSQVGIASFLSYGYTTGQESIWDRVQRLRPGHMLTFDMISQTATTRCYWKLPDTTSRLTAEEATDKLERLLDESVAQHLISDVPISVFLSGGIDSSLITSFTAGKSPHMTATTVEFDGWNRNEGELAAELCRQQGIPHALTRVTTKEFAGAEQLLGIMDEPIADNSVFSTDAVCRKTRERAKVALCGDGGDELFGGYAWYRSLVPNLRRSAAFLLERLRRMFGIGRPWPAGTGNWFEYHRLLVSPGFDAREACELFPELRPDAFDAVRDRFTPQPHRITTRLWQRQDFHTFLVDFNLARMDRISMSHSLELRVPMLDHRVVELAFSLPDSLIMDHDEQKVILRRIARKRLPGSFMKAPKRGFSCPVETLWPTENMIALVREGTLARQGWLSRKPLEALLNAPRQGTWWYRLWLLSVLEVWARRWAFAQ